MFPGLNRRFTGTDPGTAATYLSCLNGVSLFWLFEIMLALLSAVLMMLVVPKILVSDGILPIVHERNAKLAIVGNLKFNLFGLGSIYSRPTLEVFLSSRKQLVVDGVF
eukprot:scaffold1436_cov140-Amphora_coffeaeformis.AAC.2